MAGSAVSIVADELNAEGRPLSSAADMLFAAFFGWLLPRRAAALTWNGSLFRAWVYHAVIGVAAFFTFVIVIPWMDSGEPWEFFEEVSRTFHGRPWETLGKVALSVALTELGVVMLAVLVTPWGCCDEPLRRSFANGLRQTWLHTFHVLPAFYIICILGAWQEGAQRAYESTYGDVYEYVESRVEGSPYYWLTDQPEEPIGVTADSPEMLAYLDAMKTWETETERRQAAIRRFEAERQQAIGDYHRNQPLIVRLDEMVIVLTVYSLGGWMLWSLIRAVATSRPRMASPCEPTCETCGYNLRMLPMEGYCPECGSLVVESLGEDVRPGPPLMRRPPGLWRGYRRTVGLALLRPSALGRMMPTRSPLRGHGVVLAIHMLGVYAVYTATALLYLQLMRMRHPEWYRGYYDYPFFAHEDAVACVGIGGVCLFGLLAAIGLCVCGVTVVARWWTKRNLGQVAIAMASYGSCLLTVWTVVLCAGFLGINWFDPQLTIVWYFQNPFMTPVWFALSLVGLVTLRVILRYAAIVMKGTMAARWANR